MLTFVNKCWKFKTESELNAFLNDAMDSNDDYRIQNHGISAKGEYYAFGEVIARNKFGKPQAQVQNTQAQVQNTQAQVTTF